MPDFEDIAAQYEGVPAGHGYVHSRESWTALDGPGPRYLLFLTGCALRCKFCCNPDTWAVRPDKGNAKLTAASDIVKEVERKKGFYSPNGGGITISGGDPLMQPEFVRDIFRGIKRIGLTTCLATTGFAPQRAWDIVLPWTDIALVCVKSFRRSTYQDVARVDALPHVLKFLEEVEKRRIRLWVQFVVVPGVTDLDEEYDALVEWAQDRPNLEVIELLPYHNLGLEKWEKLGIPYPYKDVPRMEAAAVLERARHLRTRVKCTVRCDEGSHTHSTPLGAAPQGPAAADAAGANPSTLTPEQEEAKRAAAARLQEHCCHRIDPVEPAEHKG